MIHDLKIRKEVDPHFFLNSFTTLAHLIHADADKAYAFNGKLAQVYKYFLINKERELVRIDDELNFVQDYFYLLQVRHDDKLQLVLDEAHWAKGFIIPFSLQFLVDHAIKHNSFSAEYPLQINIRTVGEWIDIIARKSGQDYSAIETETGLRDLSARYQQCCNREIMVEESEKNFTVKLPLIVSTLNK